jgi:hypothetical protein
MTNDGFIKKCNRMMFRDVEVDLEVRQVELTPSRSKAVRDLADAFIRIKSRAFSPPLNSLR